MKIRTRLTLWYGGMLLGSLLLMGGVLHYELVGESERGLPPETPSVKIADILLFYGVPTVVVLALGGSYLIHRALRPVEDLAASAERVHAGNLRERIAPSGRGDELDRLAQAFNAMLARVEAGTASVRDFAVHASHELKTPLTILNMETELAIMDPAGLVLDRFLSSHSEELRRLSRLVDALGLVAKAEASIPIVAKEQVDLGRLTQLAAEDAGVLGRPLGIKVDLIACASVWLSGDPDKLRQVLLNLLDNAVKHSRSGGWVRVELRQKSSEAWLRIDNSAEELPLDLVRKLFGRFAKGDSPRAGSGLGLNIAKLIVEGHGGRISYEVPASGTVRFTVTLPTASKSGQASPEARPA